VTWPARIADEAMLEEVMSRPDPALVADLAAVPGDLLVLGAAGKMGPALCRLAKRADWVARGGRALGKPTKFEVRDGRF
jgi:hypothetical protein